VPEVGKLSISMSRTWPVTVVVAAERRTPRLSDVGGFCDVDWCLTLALEALIEGVGVICDVVADRGGNGGAS